MEYSNLEDLEIRGLKKTIVYTKGIYILPSTYIAITLYYIFKGYNHILLFLYLNSTIECLTWIYYCLNYKIEIKKNIYLVLFSLITKIILISISSLLGYCFLLNDSSLNNNTLSCYIEKLNMDIYLYLMIININVDIIPMILIILDSIIIYK
jgi:hypothetical protein